MLGKFRNRAIKSVFEELEGPLPRDEFYAAIGWLVQNAHELSQIQLNYLSDLLSKPWKAKRGAAPQSKRVWVVIHKLRRKYDADKIIPTQREVIQVFVSESKFTEDAARKIFSKYKKYIYHIPAPKGRPQKSK